MIIPLILSAALLAAFVGLMIVIYRQGAEIDALYDALEKANEEIARLKK